MDNPYQSPESDIEPAIEVSTTPLEAPTPPRKYLITTSGLFLFSGTAFSLALTAWPPKPNPLAIYFFIVFATVGTIFLSMAGWRFLPKEK